MKCYFYVLYSSIYVEMKCLSKDRHNKPCRFAVIEDTRFCKNHQYMCDYTDEMVEGSRICSCCKKMYYFGDGRKICDKCAERSKNNRVKARETVELCAKESCEYKRSDENKYCNFHQLQLFVDETVNENKKVCKGYIRGCRSKLDVSYELSKCKECLENDRLKDKNRRDRAKAIEFDASVEKLCNTCCKILPLQRFIGKRTETTITCDTCREANKIQEAKRDKEHRNEIARINDSKPERIAVKKRWRENNYEKVAEYCMNTRQHRIERDGIDEYLKHNAENAKKWRENNPDKVKENNQRKINNINTQYNVYNQSARRKQLQFDISIEEFEIIIKNPCNYCGIIQERGFNGIDRIASNIGYTNENSISCCSMCNYMKNTLSISVLVHRAEHILTYNGFIDGRLFPELFNDYNGMVFSRYKQRASAKGLEFSLTQDEFTDLTEYSVCYLCGKENSRTHMNGIDRYDNTIGYTMENSRTCCADCNYIKREFSYDDVLNKMKLIYERNKGKYDMDANIHNKPMISSNKKTPEQLKIESEIKKKQRRLELEAKYKDTEYKKMRAKQIAENRRTKLE